MNGGYVAQTTQAILSNEKYVAIDVGAALGVQPWWQEVLEFATVYAYEPNKSSSEKLKQLYHQYDYHVIENALDIDDSEKQLYLTNIPTGSSLLKPSSAYKYVNPSYFFPYKEEKILTYSAKTSFAQNNINDIDLMKIDTQGTELNILKGLGDNYLNKLLAVEFEAGLPGAYEEQPTFLEVHKYMTDHNFELFDLRSSRGNIYFNTELPYKKKHKVSKKIHEVDVLYFKNLNYILDNKDQSKLRKLIISYCVYSFFDEALVALQAGYKIGMFTDGDAKLINNAIVKWHDSKSVYFGQYHWFNYSS